MKKTMGLSNWVFLVPFFIHLVMTPLSAQNEYAAVEKAKYDGTHLRLTFVNCSSEILLAPEMNKRRGNNGSTLFKEYYQVTGDTVTIDIDREVSARLYDITNRERGTTSGRVFYTDHLLKPGKRYRSKVRLVLPSNVSIIKINGYVLPLCR